MLYRYKKLNAYPMLCMNGCRIEKVKYNDSYVNLVLKDGFLTRTETRTIDGMFSVEGSGENVKIFITEIFSKADALPCYKTKQISIDEFIKRLGKCEAEIKEEYHSANRILLRGEIFREVKALEFNHHLQEFELQFRSEKDLMLYYYFNEELR